MRRYFIFILLLITKFSFSQQEISWTDLEDIEFSEQYVQEVNEYILFPNFGLNLRELDGQEIIISGYVLSIDPDEGYYVLSKGPFASCFFCGEGGPETIIELSLKSDKDSFFMDQFVTMKGVLKLNSEDIYRCVYILEYAEARR